MYFSSVRALHYAGVFAVVTAVTSVCAHCQVLQTDAILPAPTEQSLGLFGTLTALSAAEPMRMRWNEFEAGVAQDVEALARCRTEPTSCSGAELSLIAIINNVRNVEGRAKLGMLNREINLAIVYASDALQHGKDDVWSSAIETITAGRGDCEDFAIAKYVGLRELGFLPEDLQIVVGTLRHGETHAVLAARLDGRWLILDNRRMTLVEDNNATEMRPLFAFAFEGVKNYELPTMLGGVATASGR